MFLTYLFSLILISHLIYHLLDPSKKVLKEGAIPCLNLPLKSFENIEKPPRNQSSIEKRNQTKIQQPGNSLNNTTSARSFGEFKKELLKTKIKPWIFECSEEIITLKFFEKPYIIPKFELIVDSEMRVLIL